MAQIVVVNEVLVAQRHAENTPPDQRPYLVLDQVPTPRVMKAIGKAVPRSSSSKWDTEPSTLSIVWRPEQPERSS